MCLWKLLSQELNTFFFFFHFILKRRNTIREEKEEEEKKKSQWKEDVWRYAKAIGSILTLKWIVFFFLLYCLSNCIMVHLRTVGNVCSNSELRQPNAANKIYSSVFVCLLYEKDFFAEKYPTILKERHFLLSQWLHLTHLNRNKSS